MTRRTSLLTAAVIALAVFNITFRLGRESVGEWDESLYATTAWEMTRSGDLIGTTFDGVLDYYNSKPPLNVWLIAMSFELFGVSLASLRLPSAAAAMLTVVVFQWWTRRAFGTRVSLVASVVLATSFGFLHIHAARSGNPDAILTAAVFLVVVVLSDVSTAPWRRVWLGPLLGVVFLLKGMAVLQPLLLIALFETFARVPSKTRWAPLTAAAIITAATVAAWVFLRWHVDQWEFLKAIVRNDFLALSLTQLEGHKTGLFFYLGVLQKYQYEWLAAAIVAISLTWRAWREPVRRLLIQLQNRQPRPILLLAWAIVTLVLPSAMQTRLAWYLNSFYPLFALLVGIAIAEGLSGLQGARRARIALIAVAASTLIVAESKSLWRLYEVTNLDTSVQGLLIRGIHRGSGQRVYRDRLSRAEAFVVRAVLEAEFVVEDSLTGRPKSARRGDLVVVAIEGPIPGLRLLGRFDGFSVHVAE